MVVRRSCINTRRRAKIVNHVNTAKTSSEKNEYKVDLQRLHEVEEVTTGLFTLFLDVNVSRYQLSLYRQSSSRQASVAPIADLAWAYYDIIWDK
jgi:hypothetical protein